MPIDPKKFRETVASHFEKITEEELLKNLRKSSPYLFVENLKHLNAVEEFQDKVAEVAKTND